MQFTALRDALQGFLGFEVQDARVQGHGHGQGCEAAPVTGTSQLGNGCLAQTEGVPGRRNLSVPFCRFMADRRYGF